MENHLGRVVAGIARVVNFGAAGVLAPCLEACQEGPVPFGSCWIAVACVVADRRRDRRFAVVEETEECSVEVVG